MMPLRNRGLTLIELMMAVAVAAVLMAIAGPSFQQALNRNRLASVANELTGAVQLARAEAVRANRRVTLCSSSDGSACTSATNTWAGWILFVDTDGDGSRDSGEAVVKSGTFDAPVVVKSSANITAADEQITFRGDGTARGTDDQTLLTGTLAVCVATTQPATNVHAVTLAFGSRTSVIHRDGAGACATPSDS
ncbi:MAG: GspH/FimT family pseudopilin [Rubrivivax sp.]|jgi:type IV fimbrial biogenesis protein FimT|nr:GspH/FimT family pseudopilin [Rubrivivax sp.]